MSGAQAVHAYTPGLRVTASTVVSRLRRLPLPGEVHVAVGDHVRSSDVVASTSLPGRVHTLNVAHELNCAPGEIGRYVVKQVGESIRRGEVLAETRALWGLLHSYVKAPIEGTIESISAITGQVLFRGDPIPVQLDAYVDGVVTEVYKSEGVTVRSRCALVQGIFGIGGERYGPLMLTCDAPGQLLDACNVPPDCAGRVLVSGGRVTYDALQAAIEYQAVAIVAAAIDSDDLDRLTGEPIGVAITGHEDIPLSLLVTEGFGELAMAESTLRILRDLDGRQASVSGVTQIRAGVIRPEVIVASGGEPPADAAEEPVARMSIGSRIRIIRAPHFGELAEVVALPTEPAQIETEACVRVLQARLADDSVVTIPRANVELIQQ